MLRFSLVVIRMDRIRNEYIRRTAQVREARLRWLGYVPNRGSVYIGQWMLKMALPGCRKRAKPQ